MPIEFYVPVSSSSKMAHLSRDQRRNSTCWRSVKVNLRLGKRLQLEGEKDEWDKVREFVVSVTRMDLDIKE